VGNEEEEEDGYESEEEYLEKVRQ